MPTDSTEISHPTGCLESAAFHSHLRRLESLQVLMTQSGLVVSEVSQFLSKAWEELNTLQREQQSCAEVQQRLLEEKAELSAQVARLESAGCDAELRIRNQESTIAKLQAELAQTSAAALQQASSAVHSEAETKLADALGKIDVLERTVQREREMRAKQLARIKHQEVAQHSNEIALLKTRLASVEQQLEAERERRARLMEVVKNHDVVVSASGVRQREVVT